jgi:hypothetical protein
MAVRPGLTASEDQRSSLPAIPLHEDVDDAAIPADVGPPVVERDVHEG